MHHRLRNREALDALTAPVGADLAAGHAPHLLGVVAEERTIQFHAKAVDHEVFEALFLAGRQQLHLEVAHADLEHAPESKVANRVAVQRNRIVKELAEEKDAGKSATAKHHVVRLLGIGATFDQRDLAADSNVILARGPLQRQDALPPVHHRIALAEKAVTADIHAVAIVTRRARNAADNIFGFENHGFHIRRTQQFQRTGKPRRTRARNHGNLLFTIFSNHNHSFLSRNSINLRAPKFHIRTRIAAIILEAISFQSNTPTIRNISS